MSVSARDRKSVIYSEVERLRNLLDKQDQQLHAQREEIGRLRARLEAPRAQPEAPRAQSTMSPARTRMELMKRLAITCEASVKWVEGQGFRQYKDGSWVAIPTHTIEFVAKGIEQ